MSTNKSNGDKESKKDERNQRRLDRKSNRQKVWIYLLFLLVFWTPFLLLVLLAKIEAKISVIAVSISVVPLLLLFIPLFERLAERIRGFKYGDIEVTLDEIVKRDTSTIISIDTDRDTIPKFDMTSFKEFVSQHKYRSDKRIVLSVDVVDHQIHLIMLFFQAWILGWLFDLRAILFLDTDQKGKEDRILGTMPKDDFLRILAERIKQLKAQQSDDTLANIVKNYDLDPDKLIIYDLLSKIAVNNLDLLSINVDEYIQKCWDNFMDALGGFSDPFELEFTPLTYRQHFKKGVQKNIISHPLNPAEFDDLIYYLHGSEKTHLILVNKDEEINVRTLDRVARELAISAIKEAQRQKV